MSRQLQNKKRKIEKKYKASLKEGKTYTKAQLSAKKRIAEGKTIAQVKAENEKAMRDKARTKNAETQKEKLKVKIGPGIKKKKEKPLTKFQKRRKARTGRY